MIHDTSEISSISLRSMAQIALLAFEGLILFGITIAFWYHIDPSQGLRDAWFWTLWLAVPIFALRVKLFGRLWTQTPLHDLLIVFIILAAFSYTHALYQRESFLAPMARPLLGMWTFVYFVEVTRASKSLKTVIILMMGMSLCLGLLALTSSQWLEAKTGILWAVIELLPRFRYQDAATSIDGQICGAWVDILHTTNCFNPRVVLSNAGLSFNVNEIAGALAWVAPVMAGFALMIPNRDAKKEAVRSEPFWMVIRIIAAIVFVIVFLALLFGQSRFALIGVIGALIVLAFMAISNNLWRYLALGLIGFIILLQASIFLNIFTPTNTANDTASVGLSTRDENSVATRLAIWQRGFQMMVDNPSAGVGMYMFRTAVAHEPYQIPYYVDNALPSPPHAHNEWLNMGAEMGVFGFILYIALQVTVLWMLWQGWTQGDPIIRSVALATFAGLLAHAAYGFGDTVALWDRFQFVLWWLVGLAGAQFTLLHLQVGQALRDVTVESIE